MPFREKIDKILKDNKLGINTVFGLEAFIKAAPGAISKPLNKGSEPGLGTIKKIREGLPGLNQDWWDTEKGDTFIKNGTYVEIPTKEKDLDELIRILVNNIDRMGKLNDWLLQRVKDLEQGRT